MNTENSLDLSRQEYLDKVAIAYMEVIIRSFGPPKTVQANIQLSRDAYKHALAMWSVRSDIENISNKFEPFLKRDRATLQKEG